MSGPKVVNIEAVRRQQKREATARLSAVSSLLADCLSLCGEDTGRQSSLEKAIHASIAKATALGEAGEWSRTLQELRTREEFLNAERSTLRERMTGLNAERLRCAHRLEKTILQTRNAILKLPEAEREPLLETLETSDGDPTIIDVVICTLEEKSVALGSSEENAGIKDLLAEFQSASPVEKISSAPDPDVARLDQCWKILGEWETFTSCDPAHLKSWKDAASAAYEAPIHERALRLDSLVLELSRHLQAERERSTLLSDLALLSEEFQDIKNEASAALLARIKVASHNSMPAAEIRALVNEARAFLGNELAKSDVIEQRSAVLRALASCGYEVRQGMQTAWIEDGHLVLKKPDERQYAVELTAPATGTAIQTRVVALGLSSRDPLRDKEMEDNWCGDFKNLRELLVADGFSAALKHSNPSGSVPMKSIASNLAEQNRSRDVTLPKDRFLD